VEWVVLVGAVVPGAVVSPFRRQPANMAAIKAKTMTIMHSFFMNNPPFVLRDAWLVLHHWRCLLWKIDAKLLTHDVK
jgi:hypothetical protein